MERLYKEYGQSADFRIVYIREAHPSDGRQVQANVRAGVEIKDPKTDSERSKAAGMCVDKLKISIPAVVDGMDNAVDKAYGGWPTRMYVIGKDGKIAYQGKPGPAGLKPREAEQVLKTLL